MTISKIVTPRIRHWAPRYAWDRTQVALFQLRYPTAPWLTAAAIHILESWLNPGDKGLEFGSGRSTIWFARRVSSLTSVEHDYSWYQRVSQQLCEASSDNVDYLFRALEESTNPMQMSAYAAVAEQFAQYSLDFVLVDGAVRSECALAVLEKVKPGGILIIDNVNWALPSRSRSPASRTEKQGPVSEEWSVFLERVAAWRCIWTSNGVTDTAIYFRSATAET